MNLIPDTEGIKFIPRPPSEQVLQSGRLPESFRVRGEDVSGPSVAHHGHGLVPVSAGASPSQLTDPPSSNLGFNFKSSKFLLHIRFSVLPAREHIAVRSRPRCNRLHHPFIASWLLLLSHLTGRCISPRHIGRSPAADIGRHHVGHVVNSLIPLVHLVLQTGSH